MINTRPLAPAATENQGVSLYRKIIWAAVVVGMICRLSQYFSNQSYWCDESALLLNVVQKDAATLMSSRLDAVQLTQAAPPLFLLLLKTAGNSIGTSEYAMRLVPLLAGLLSLLLFTRLCVKLLPAKAAAVAVVFFALADNVNYQCAQVKPYSSDVLFAILLVYVALAWRPTAEALRRLAWAAILTAIAVWCSYPAIFIFAAISLAIAPSILKERRPKIVKYLAWNALAFISFALVYCITIQPQQDPFLRKFWSGQFLNYSAPLLAPVWLVSQIGELFRFVYAPIGWALLIPAVLGGCFLKRIVGTNAAWTIGGTFAVSILAAALHLYPFGGFRLSLYLAPFVFMLVGIGIAGIPDHFPTWSRTLLAGLAILLVGVGIVWGSINLFQPRSGGDSRQVIEFLKQHRQSNEPVYVIDTASFDFLWYWPGLDDQIHLYTKFDQKITHAPAFWILTSCKPQRGKKERARIMDQPGAVADPARTLHTRSGDAVLFRQSNASLSSRE